MADLCGEDKAAANKSICKSRAGQCNISYVQAAAVVRADEFQFGFYLLTSTLYFQLRICTGRTSNEFPAFANTQRWWQYYRDAIIDRTFPALHGLLPATLVSFDQAHSGA